MFRIKINKTEKIFVFLVFCCFLFSFGKMVHAGGTTYYVDCNAANDTGDGTSPATAWKNITKANTSAGLNATVMFKRGCSWAQSISPSQNGITYTLYDVADTGALPAIPGSSGYAINMVTGRTGIKAEYLDFQGTVSVGASDSLSLSNVIIRRAAGIGLSVANSATVTLNNSLITQCAGSAISMAGTGAITTVRNSIIEGNGYGTGVFTGGAGVAVATGNTIDYDYSLILGNNRVTTASFIAGNFSGSGTITDGGHNYSTVPNFKALPFPAVKIVLSIDGDDYAGIPAYSSGLADAFDAAFGTNTIPFLAYLTNLTGISSGGKTILSSLPARGIEIGSHSWSHSDVTKTSMFTVSTTNSGTNTVTIDRTAHTLSLASSGNPENNILIDWSVTDKTLCDFKKTINVANACVGLSATGKGWTISNTTNMNDPVRLKALDNQTSTTFPYVVNMLMSAYRDEEILDSAGWIASNIGTVPVSFAYGGGWSDAGAEAYMPTISSTFTSARSAGGGYMYMPSIHPYMLSGQAMSWAMNGFSTEADIRKVARHTYLLAAAAGGYIGMFWHLTDAVNVTNQKLIWFVDEIRNLGGTFVTQSSIAAGIYSDGHTTSDGGLSWTKTYTDTSDYRLSPGSSLINSGTNLGVPYNVGLSPASYTNIQLLDRANYDWDLGPYVYDDVAPTVTAFSIPATSSSLTVSVSSFTATDDIGVTGYLLTESPTAPLAGNAGWTGSAPANYTFSTYGSKTLYAWAKDANGNISTSLNAPVAVSSAGDLVNPTPGASGVITTASVTTSSLTLNWTKGTDDVSAQGVLQYRVYQSSSNNIDTVTNIEANGTPLNTYTTDINTLPVSGLSSTTTYYFNVILKDEAGNKASYVIKSQATESFGLPTATNVTISGTKTIGQTLTGSYAFSDPNSLPESGTTYAWLRSSSSGGTYTAIGGATAITYILTSSDIGQYLKFQVTPSSASGTGSASLSSATTQIQDNIITYIISILSTNGTVAKNPDQANYDFGSSIILTATPNSGYAFSDWSGDITSSANPMTVSMDADKNITANFTLVYVPSSGGGGGGGSYTPPTPISMPGCGSRITGFSTATGQSCSGNVAAKTAIATTNTINVSAINPTLMYNFGFTTLKLGSIGDTAKELQRYLNDTMKLGLVLDGKIGPKTIAVIKQWQKNHGLVSDGLIGPKTKAMMILGK